MTSGFFTCTDGTRLRVFDHGDHDGDPDSPVTVILVHCYALDHREWDAVLAALDLGGAAIRVLRYDQRGYGESGGVTPHTATLAQLGDDLAELIVALVAAGRVVLAGHSMGGMAIMAMAERHPELTHYPRVLEPFVRWLVFGEDADGRDVAHVARLVAACRPLTMLLF